jgi:hypothetical protein
MPIRRHRKRATRRRHQKQRGGGGSSAHGFEMPDGKVKYCLRGDYEGLMEAVDLFQNGKITLEECDLEAESVDTFFNDEKLYEEEDSTWRILKMQDGSIKGRRWGLEGMFTYTK